MRRRRKQTLATALACALALGLAAPGLAALPGAEGAGASGCSGTAWADNLSNKAVPTDDTGMVEPSKDGAEQPEESGTAAEQPTLSPEEAAGETGSGQDAAGASPDDAAPADAGAAPADGQGGDGSGGNADAADGAEDGAADGAASEESAAPLVTPDPVFGTGVNKQNLMNPQQKPDSSFIYDTSIKALQEADPYLNDQTVQVTGEVVGDRIKAEFDPGFCWIVLQANDGSYTEVPIFLDTALTEPIDTYGAYGRKGTTLQVRGTFHLACPDHEGLTDLHADTVNVVTKGYVSEQKFDLGAFLPGLLLVLAGLVMLLVFRQMREGQR